MIHEGDLEKQKKRYSRDIRMLRKDITTRREELCVAVYGDKQFLRNAFQEHRRLQLTYMNSQAEVKGVVAVYGDKQFFRNAFQEHRWLQLTYMNSQAEVKGVTRREELCVAVYGDKQFFRNAFQEHRRLQLTYMNSQAEKVLASIHQENFNKRKQLDRIRYTKKKKMEKFRLTQLESAELRDRLLYEVGAKLPAEKKEQAGRCLMGATEMGQLAMEYLDDRKFEFSKLEKEIKANMKERQRTLKLAKREIAFLTDSFPDLLRAEEATNLDDLYENEDAVSQHSVHWELEEVLKSGFQYFPEALTSLVCFDKQFNLLNCAPRDMEGKFVGHNR
ncbi:Uncharacterized protein OBRU01_08146 [Operophtera brumata]|uniref:Uncharacterized protein n=1 Tax=Operophtera brumata TaxID=104452 RepID=A0A0L7L916_OPEBR|nr:Uncharacterized protein OBRU01_08146 [Operophtera brumata]